LPTGTMPPEAMVVDEGRRLDSTEYGNCFRGRASGEGADPLGTFRGFGPSPRISGRGGVKAPVG